MDDYQGFVTPSRCLNQEAKNEESKDAEAEYCEMDGAFTTPMGSHKCPRPRRVKRHCMPRASKTSC